MQTPDPAFKTIPLARIAPSLTNPRKTFNPDKLQELANSIAASGVHQPILVRALSGSRAEDTFRSRQPNEPLPEFELVAGERRWRASKLAGVDTIPAIVRELTDQQALEIQIIENLQRDDLTALEEAEGYQALVDATGIDKEEIGAKIGKSRTYVYNRLKLLDLGTEGREAMRAGQIDASRALLIARVPDSKLQLKALKYATTPNGHTNEIPSVRELQGWLKDNVMLDLANAVFKITDARLVEAAGSCTECPKRTGANPDLFSDVKSSDVCTDPPCFHKKAEAHRAQLVKKAEAKGLRIVEGKEAQEMLAGGNWRNTPNGYTSLTAKRPDLTPEGERPTTLAQVLGKDAPAPILFIHPKTQEPMELVPEDEADAILLAKGLIKAEDDSQERQAATLENLQADLKELRQDAERALARETHAQLYAATRSAVRATTTAQARQLLASDLLRAWLLDELDTTYDVEGMAEDIGFEFQDGQDEQDAVAQHIRRLGDTDLLRATALYMLGKDSHFRLGTTPDILNAAVQALGVDTKPIKRAASTAVKAEYDAKIKAAQAEIDALKGPPPNAPAARREKSARGKPEAKGQPTARAAKLSPKEAKRGIADALQDMEGAAPPPTSNQASAAWPFPSEGAADKPAAPAPQTPADPLFAKALKAITKAQKASVRLLKDELGVGTTKAMELMASLEAAGKVSEATERGARKVLVAA